MVIAKKKKQRERQRKDSGIQKMSTEWIIQFYFKKEKIIEQNVVIKTSIWKMR